VITSAAAPAIRSRDRERRFDELIGHLGFP
jgi:hypothetical protein